jgi:membrane protein implicated in regulation of membrane protease activity
VLAVCLLVLGVAFLVASRVARDDVLAAYHNVVIALAVVSVPLVWADRRMRQPHLLRLVRERLELTSDLGGKRVLPLDRVEDDKGVVVDLETRTRIVVGARRYDGAEDFHRALRARKALLTGDHGPC